MSTKLSRQKNIIILDKKVKNYLKTLNNKWFDTHNLVMIKIIYTKSKYVELTRTNFIMMSIHMLENEEYITTSSILDKISADIFHENKSIIYQAFKKLKRDCKRIMTWGFDYLEIFASYRIKEYIEKRK